MLVFVAMSVDIAGDSSSEASVAEDGPRPRRVRAARLIGPERLFLLVASCGGLGSSIGEQWPVEWPVPAVGEVAVLGLVSLYSWSYAPPASGALDAMHGEQRRLAQRQCSAQVLGFLDYPVLRFAGLARLVVHRFAPDVGTALARRLREEAVEIVYPQYLGERRSVHSSFGAVLDAWRDSDALRILHVSAFAARLFVGECACLHSVALTKRCRRRVFVEPDVPGRSQLAALVQHGILAIADVAAAPRPRNAQVELASVGPKLGD